MLTLDSILRATRHQVSYGEFPPGVRLPAGKPAPEQARSETTETDKRDKVTESVSG